MQKYNLFVTGHKGFETSLLHEVRDILAELELVPVKAYGGLECSGGLDAVYAICLYSRLANRVFCELARARTPDEDALYEAVSAVDWSEQLRADDSIAVSATLSRSRLKHSHFVALKTKDAIVDQFRAATGRRPSVDPQNPDLRIQVHIHRDQARISLDLSGGSLHRRGYRLEHGGAPLKEHLAAAILHRAGWNFDMAGSGQLLDPMCGSGSFAIEAALIASHRAPGLTRERHGFNGWRQHDEQRWQSWLEAARERIRDRPECRIFASDSDARVLDIARANAGRAGVGELIRFEHAQVSDLKLPASDRETLVVTNPPWGQRLQAEQGLAELYQDLGDCLRRHRPARLVVITANPDLLHRLDLRPLERKPVKNGAMDCVLASFTTETRDASETADAQAVELPTETEPLVNRLRKNARHLDRWARRSGIDCYRIYDADLPEFAFALDFYRSALDPDDGWYHLQEYQAPASIDAQLAARRLEWSQAAVRQVFAVDAGHLYVKTRQRQRGKAQYQRRDSQREWLPVREGQARLLINLGDYLDSGLFLDHRPLRARLFREAHGKRLLNLFCYTGSVGVQAGLGGATTVVNVDLSANYLRWAEENFAQNDLVDESRYQFLRADVGELLHNPAKFDLQPEFDLIFLDPPSFSNSSAMAHDLDIQRDHVTLVDGAMRLLRSDGLLLFSTNKRGFRLAPELTERYAVQDITRSTIDEDFRRRPNIHGCWEVRHGD